MDFVKSFKLDCGKSLLAILILQFVFASFIVFNVNVEDVSAAPLPPYIKVVPETTFNTSLTVGMNYTVAIVTDYAGTDIWSWQFSLTYDPDVLHGGVNITDIWTGNGITKIFSPTRKPIMPGTEKVYVNQVLMVRDVDYYIDTQSRISFRYAPTSGAEVKATYLFGVVNGDLITKTKNATAEFFIGQGFDNTVGKLSRLSALFRYITPNPPFTTSGPGTLAYVTFTVIGTGYSNITLGTDTNLLGWDPTSQPPPEGKQTTIIDAPDHIGHGYFDNIPNAHDVAVSKIVTVPTAILGDLVEINVTVRNEGNFTESFDVTVYSNTTLVETQLTNLTRGAKKSLTFYWNTTNTVAGKYIINATALPAEDSDQSDNSRTTQIEIKTVHDVTVDTLDISSEVFVAEFVPIDITVRNEGNFEENVTLLVSYKKNVPTAEPVVINSTNFLLAARPTSRLFQINWNTTEVATGTYRINATIIFDQDEEPSDNILTKLVILKLGHDVTIVSITPTPRQVFVGELISIRVDVKNNGGYNETFEVKTTYNTTEIDTKSIESLPPGNLTSLQFNWTTTGVTPSSYVITAEAILAGDVNQGNNKKIYRSVFIELPPGNVSGYVLDANTHLPIEGVNVVSGTYTSATNSVGYYQISDVPTGTYNITASKNGYQSTSKTATVIAGQTIQLNFSLTPLPTTGEITGVVIDDSTGNPIEGANVTTNGYYDTTDSNGNYHISNVPPGTYTVTASKNGYESNSETDVVVAVGQTATVDFELTPIPPSDNTLYIVLAAVGIIVIAVVALVYFYKFRKRT